MEPGAVNMLSIDCPDIGSDDDVLPPATSSSNGARQKVPTSISLSSGEVILGPSPDSSTGTPGGRPSILGDSSDSEDDLLDS